DRDSHGVIPSGVVYEIYGQPILREVVRTVVAKYEINEVASSREAINAEVYEAISNALEGTPVNVKRVAFANLQFPDVIVAAKEEAAKRRANIQQAEAEKQIMLVNMQTRLERAKAERAVRREQALAAQEENAIFAK
ncbi:MAG: SPFH domain-containing protein, partial [Candidatus Dadabacteria bacterium]|nr:SPFH domain-containing protein [Candidatus Dadabacteria bacterium]